MLKTPDDHLYSLLVTLLAENAAISKTALELTMELAAKTTGESAEKIKKRMAERTIKNVEYFQHMYLGLVNSHTRTARPKKPSDG